MSVSLITGCQEASPAPPQPAVEPGPWQSLEARQLEVRLAAIKLAGESGDRRAIPLLVDRLQEQDVVVRMFAAHALRQLTGHDYGYDYKAPLPERREAVQRWREALNAGVHCPPVGTADG